MARMTSPLPARKVMAGSLGAAVATILIYGIETFLEGPLPAPVTAAANVIIVFLFGYFVPPALRDTVSTEDPADPVVN
jgi:hypothetical protein